MQNFTAKKQSPVPLAYELGNAAVRQAEESDTFELDDISHPQSYRNARISVLSGTSDEGQALLIATRKSREDADNNTRQRLSTMIVRDQRTEALTASRGYHAVPSSTTANASSASWLPVTLRMPYLSMLLTYTFLLLIIVITLTIYSRSHGGLGNYDGSAGVFFSWRFLPTLLAVVYVVLVANLLQDVRRTEVYARMSRGPSAASISICWPVRAWWYDPFDALSKEKNNGTRSWALLFISITYILGTFVVSPLSAALLTPDMVKIEQRTDFRRSKATFDLVNEVIDRNILLFRTISGSLLGKQTSPWISDNYFVLPFWPDTSFYPTPPVSANIPADILPQSWTSETTIFTLETNCTDVSFVGLSETTGVVSGLVLPNSTDATCTYPYYCGNWTVHDVHLHADPDCSIHMYEYNASAWSDLTGGDSQKYTPSRSNNIGRGGGFWASDLDSIPNIDYANFEMFRTLLTHTGTCQAGSFWLTNRPYTSGGFLEAIGGICSTSYYMADIMATVAITNLTTTVDFDRVEYKKRRHIIPSDLINLTALNENFFTSHWADKVQEPKDYFNMPYFMGPLQVIAASPHYEYDLSLMMDQDKLLSIMQALQQQWLGQVLMQSLNTTTPETPYTIITATVSTTSRQIVVVFGIGLSLSVLLLLSATCIILTLFLTRHKQRPLNLNREPSPAAAKAALITRNPEIVATMRDLIPSFAAKDEDNAKKMTFIIQNNQLIGIEPIKLQDYNGHTKMFDNTGAERIDRQFAKSGQPPKYTTPLVLRVWMGLLLLLFAVVLVVVLAVLYGLFLTKGLFSHNLTYEADIRIGETVSRLAPYSIAPTLVAVTFKLWYGAIVEVIRRQQSFYSMYQRPALLSKSILADYVNVPLQIIFLRASKNKHWLLMCAGLGALTTEIFTVAMSALWTRDTLTRSSSFNISQHLELRAVPVMYTIPNYEETFGYNPTKAFIADTVYGTFLTSWLYDSVLEISQQSQTPAWSKDDLAFIPVDLSETNAAALAISKSASAGVRYNVTVPATAVRARLECAPLYFVSNRSSWLTSVSVDERAILAPYDTSNWGRPPATGNITVFEVKPQIDIRSPVTNDFWPTGGAFYLFDCCSNITSTGPGDSVIGYWGTGFNEAISVKWIAGRPLSPAYLNGTLMETTSGQNVHLRWLEAPQLQAIDCTPHIENADAFVTVDASSGIVYNYTVGDSFTNTSSAWLDDFIVRSTQHIPNSAIAYQNVTVSFGQIFVNSLLTASSFVTYTSEPDERILGEGEHAFTLRNRGTNVDFMSYSMLQLVGNDQTALLDADLLATKASYVFGIFFKHFALENVTFQEGGSVFQPIGAKLAPAISDALNSTSPGYRNSYGLDSATSIPAVIEVPVDALVMSPVAVFLSLGILGLLMIIIAGIFITYYVRKLALPRDIDTLASVVAFFHSSQSLLKWAEVHYRTEDRDQESSDNILRAYMGQSAEGDRAGEWSIDIVETGQDKSTPSLDPLLTPKSKST